jgi:hypothetical protein
MVNWGRDGECTGLGVEGGGEFMSYIYWRKNGTVQDLLEGNGNGLV